MVTLQSIISINYKLYGPFSIIHFFLLNLFLQTILVTLSNEHYIYNPNNYLLIGMFRLFYIIFLKGRIFITDNSTKENTHTHLYTIYKLS